MIVGCSLKNLSPLGIFVGRRIFYSPPPAGAGVIPKDNSRLEVVSN